MIDNNKLDPDIQKLINQEPKLIEAIENLQVLQELLNTGQLSEDEYNELVNDILDLQRIDELASDIETQAKISKGFLAIRNIIGLTL